MLCVGSQTVITFGGRLRRCRGCTTTLEQRGPIVQRKKSIVKMERSVQRLLCCEPQATTHSDDVTALGVRYP